MKKLSSYLGWKGSEKFNQKKIPKLSVMIIAILTGAIGTYLLFHSFAATDPNLIFYGTRVSDYFNQSAPNAVTEVPDPLGSGQSVFKMIVKNSDVYPATPTADPRAQLLSPSNIKNGDDFWWSTKIFLPNDFPSNIPTSGWLNLLEGAYGPPFDGTPPWEFEVHGSDFSWRRNNTYGFDNPWKMPLVKNQWVSVMVHEKLSSSGFIEMWVNGQQVTFFPSGGDNYNPNHVAPTQHLNMQTLDHSNSGGDNFLVLQSYRKLNMLDSLTVYEWPMKIGTTRTSVEDTAPIDTISPSVSITTPATGTVVSGSSVAVSATASDDTAVTGVQFKLDGNNLGAEDTSSPYSTTWDTTTATNGTHTLTAVAKDAAGNTKTSASVSVTVSNNTGGTSGCTTIVSSVSAAQSAVSSASSGQTVCLANGTYGKLSLNATKSAPGVTVRAQNPNQATINGADLSGSYITLAQFKITSDVSIIIGSQGMTVYHNFITGGYMGVNVCNSTTAPCYDTKIIGNKFQGPYGEDAIRANRYEDSANDADTEALTVSQNEITGVVENGNHSDCLQTVWVGNNITFDHNYEHDNRCQGFFIKDQNSLCSSGSGNVCGTVHNVKVFNNIFTRNNEPCAASAPGCGQPTTIQLFGPEDGVNINRNTMWGGDLTLTLRDPGWANVSVTNNAVSRKWTDTTAPFNSTYSASNNLFCNSNYSGSWGDTGFTSNCNPLFPAPNKAGGDDFRLGGSQGVDWAPSQYTYGPQTDGITTPPSDTTAPTVSMTAPAASSTVSGSSVAVSATASDDTAVTGVQFKLDGNNLGAEDTSSPYSTTWDTTTATNGTHTLTAVAKDAAGNTKTSASVSVTVSNTVADTTAPTVSFTSPTNGSTVSGTVTSTVSASDNVAVTKVDISLDGTLKMTDNTSPYNYSFDSKTLTNASHTLSAKAYDAAGNTTTATITVAVNNPDTTKPNAPTNLHSTASTPTSISLAWTASTDTGSNPTGVVKYNVLRNGVVVAQPTTTSYTDTGLTANTSYNYSVQAVDGAGNVSANSSIASVKTPAFSNPLHWSPPALNNPISINVANGNTVNNLDTSKDYIINLPNYHKIGSTALIGGHNIVIKGGLLTIGPSSVADDINGRALYIKNTTGIVHIEGVSVDNTTGGQGDGIAINAPEAIVQLENTRMIDLKGTKDSAHADCVQPWGGVKELRIDHFTCSDMYQGLQIDRDLGNIETANIMNTNLINLPNTITSDSSLAGGYSVWLSKNGCADVYPIQFNEVYVEPKPGRALEHSVWPDNRDPSCPAVASGNQVSWPALTSVISGNVKLGPPPNGDFVTSAQAGLNYTSPSYGSAPLPDTTTPTTPTNLQAAAADVDQVNLTWTASTDSGGSGLAGYNVYRGGTKLNSSLVTTTSFGDSTVIADTSYSYKVEAVDGSGNKSAQTAAASVTTPKAKTGDLTGASGTPDGVIDLRDISFVIREYGKSGSSADITGPNGTPDGIVDLRDISYLIKNYGK